MILHLLWIIPSLIFALAFLQEQRRLINSYLLMLSLILFALVQVGFAVVSVETRWGQNEALVIVAILALMIPISILISAIFLFFNGRKMMSYEGRRLANLLSLLYSLAIIGAIGLHFIPSRFLPLQIPLMLDYLIFYFTFLYLSYIFYSFWCNLLPVRRAPDYIIVLGSGLIGDKVPPLLSQRLDKGKAIYEKFERKPRLIVSGGQGGDELISEAEAMAAYLEEKGVPKEAILIENQSRTTQENLQFSKQIMARSGNSPKSVLVVTNSFHALRAGIYMRRLQIPGRSIGSRTAFYYLPSAWIRETIGLIVLYWKWHVTFLLFLLLPWLINQLVGLIQGFMNLF